MALAIKLRDDLRDTYRAGVCGAAAEFRRPALLARGYWGSTVGKNEAAGREYIQNQEKENKGLEQLELAAL